MTEQDSCERLGVLPGADARDIRRAYARALKKIDQALDPAGFQTLREAYECALQAHAWRLDDDAGQADPDTAAADVILAEPLQDATPEQLAGVVADAFTAVLATLGATQATVSDAPWQAALQHALADERLFAIDARFAFEQRVADILVRGWRPGHEALLAAAIAVFDWTRGLGQGRLGYAGIVLECALVERVLFERQAGVDKQAQKRVLRLLRQGHTPEPSRMMQDLPFFARMQERFPHWLSIVAPEDGIAYWEACCPPPGQPMPVAAEQTSWPMRIFLCVVCLIVVMELGKTLTLSPALTPPAAEADAAPAGQPPTQARMDDVVARVHYPVGENEELPPFTASFDVTLDAGGRVVDVHLTSSSGNSGLDAAMKAALTSTPPFPPETRRNFDFTFTHPSH